MPHATTLFFRENCCLLFYVRGWIMVLNCGLHVIGAATSWILESPKPYRDRNSGYTAAFVHNIKDYSITAIAI